MPSTIHLRVAEEKQNGFCQYIVANKVTLKALSYSACVVCTKTIVHLSVGESDGYKNIHHYPPPLRIIIPPNFPINQCNLTASHPSFPSGHWTNDYIFVT